MRTTKPFSLSQSQSLIWLGQQLAPDAPVYDSVCTFEICCDLNPTTFVSAFELLVQKSDSMRMTIDLSASTPTGQILESDFTACQYVDLTDRPHAMEAWVSQRMMLPIDPQNCMYDSVLLKLGANHFCWYLNVHHFCNDGANLEITFRRQEECYNYLLAKEAGELAEEPNYPAFVDYLAQEQASQKSDAFAQRQEHWRDRIKAHPAPSRLYEGQSRDGGWEQLRVYVPLGIERSDAFRAAAKKPGFRSLTQNMSLFNFFATVMSAWLFRIEGEQEITFGSTSQSRNTAKERATTGLFMQLLPFQLQIDPTDTFQDIGKKVAAEQIQFLRNAMPGAASPESQKAFDVGLNMIPATMGDFCGSPCKPVWRHTGYGDIGRKVSITMQDFGSTGEFELLFDFNVSAVSPAGQQAIIKHFIATIDEACANPAQRVSQFNIMGAEEEKELAAFLDQSTVSSESACDSLWSQFEQASSANLSNVAIVDQQQTLTYQQLRDAATELAETLSARGVNDEQIVPLIGTRSASMLICVLAVMKCNATFLMVDRELPQPRIDGMLSDSQARFYIDTVDGKFDVIDLGGEEPEAGFSGSITEEVEALKRAAYVLYTSGSSGEPNGVLVSHASVSNLLRACEKIAPVDGRTRNSWWTNVGFDVSIYEIFNALLYGHSLYIPCEDVRNSPEALFVWLRQNQIDSIYLPPFFLQDFANWLQKNPRWDVQRLLVGVEGILESTLAAINHSLPQLQIVNGYGPTETTVCATFYLFPLNSHPASNDAITPIGLPADGNVCLIVDHHDQEVPQGLVGELLIGGAGLSLGYLRRPDLNRTRFVVDPTGKSGQRFFRSGDRVRLRFDGQLEFHGRADGQLKVNGFRIEPREISLAVSQHVAVDECVVALAEPDAEFPQSRLIAYFTVGNEDEEFSAADLRNQAATVLPRHMLPAKYVQVPSIPRTLNGKVDFTALECLPGNCVATTSQSISLSDPVTESEERLLKIWKQVLKIDSIGIDHDLFEVGGDSMTAIRIVAASRSEGFKLTPKIIFDNPTVRQLSAKAEQIAGEQSIEAPVTGRQSLLPVQQWFFEQGLADNNYWSHVLEVAAPVDCRSDLVQQALTAVVEHHDAFRLQFHKTENWEAIYTDQAPTPVFHFIDLEEENEDESSKQLIALEQKLCREVSISDGPLLAAGLARWSGSVTLLLAAHHLVVDAVSWQLILADLETAYLQLAANQMVRLPEKSASSQTWSQTLEGFTKSSAFESHVGYWNEVLARRVAAIDFKSSDHVTATSEHRETLSVEQTELLVRQFTRKHRARVNEVCMLALAWAINRFSGETCCQFDVEGHGRESIEGVDLSRTVGWFTSVSPMILTIDAAGDPLTNLANVRDQVRNVPLNGLGYGLLKYGIGSAPPTSLPDHEPSRILFNYLGDATDTLSTGSLFELNNPFKLVREENSSNPYWLELNVSIRSEQLVLDWSYRRDCMESATVQQLADSFVGYVRRLLDCLNEDVVTPVSADDFPLADLDAKKMAKLSSVLGKLGGGTAP